MDIERNDPRSRLAVGEDEPVAVDLRPAQPDDLAPATPCEKQQPDGVRLFPAAVPGLAVQHPMETGDLVAGQKPREHLSRVTFHGPRRVGFEMTAGDGEVHDAAEEIERVIGIAGGGPAEPVEPASDLLGHDAVERLRAEDRQELSVEEGPDALSGGRLVPLEMRLLPRAFDEVAEQRSDALGRAGRARLGLAGMAFPAGLRGAL